jgi:hypothetical protein
MEDTLMHSRFRLITTMLVASPLLAAGLQPAAAEPVDAVAAAERMCDYCADYTDAAASAGVVQTSYEIGVGYAATAEKAAATAAPAKERG